MKKVMIYMSEDQSSYGYKVVKFNFAEGTKVVNRETSKVMVSLGTFELDEHGFGWVKRIFSAMKGKKFWTIAYKAKQLKEYAIMNQLSQFAN